MEYSKHIISFIIGVSFGAIILSLTSPTIKPKDETYVIMCNPVMNSVLTYRHVGQWPVPDEHGNLQLMGSDGIPYTLYNMDNCVILPMSAPPVLKKQSAPKVKPQSKYRGPQVPPEGTTV